MLYVDLFTTFYNRNTFFNFTGKTINFIRTVCRDHSPINFPFSTVATNNQGLNDIIGPDLQSHISEVYIVYSELR